jgi:hypothetical protein
MYNSTYTSALTGLINQLVLGWACVGFLLAAGKALGGGRYAGCRSIKARSSARRVTEEGGGGGGGELKVVAVERSNSPLFRPHQL